MSTRRTHPDAVNSRCSDARPMVFAARHRSKGVAWMPGNASSTRPAPPFELSGVADEAHRPHAHARSNRPRLAEATRSARASTRADSARRRELALPRRWHRARPARAVPRVRCPAARSRVRRVTPPAGCTNHLRHQWHSRLGPAQSGRSPRHARFCRLGRPSPARRPARWRRCGRWSGSRSSHTHLPCDDLAQP